MMNYIKKGSGSNEKNKSQNQINMKKINVLKDGQTTVHDVKMTSKQKRDYAEKVLNCLSEMWDKWDYISMNNRKNPTFEGICKATTHIENILDCGGDFRMNFAFTKPEQCAIYFAFAFGAFDCFDLEEITGTDCKAIAMIKMLTSRKARNEVLNNKN